jgi:hypothetical protein
MSLGRRIDLQSAGLTVLSGLLFGLGESQLVLPAGLLLAAFLATRRAGGQPRFQLSAPAVNGLVFVIAITSAWRFAFAYGTGEVVVVGHAFGGLQAVLLFERKTARTFWDLLSLSLLMVFLSTALVQGPTFALGLAAYVYLAFSTLALICVERERLSSALGGGEDPAIAAVGRVRGSWWRLLGIAVSTLIVGPLALFLRFPERAVQTVDPRDRARGGDAAVVRGTFDEQPRWQAAASGMVGPAMLGREFWWRTGRMTAAVFAVAVVIFCVAPRFGRVEFELPPLREIAWRGARSQPLRVVGFTDRVRLGEIGSLSEDQRLVFELALSDSSGQRPYRPRGSLYLRGAALIEYRMGNWEFQPGTSLGQLRTLENERPADANVLVRQRITVEPSDRPEIFCVWPFLLVDDDPPVRFEARTERLRRRRDMLGRSFTFDLVTPAFQDGGQAALTPCDRPIDEAVHLRWPENALPGLAGLAQRWIDDSRIPADDPTARARWLQRRFLDSGQFRYSFQEKPRNALADPMEEFVTRNPEGNCEYFASALALMLRSQGIPSRLVVGFKADEYSELTETYRVRQAHAHAWVEAYIPADRLPTGAARPDGISDWSHGGWLRLDPTPSFSTAPTGVVRQMENWLSLLHSFWRDHVVSMSGSRQRDAIYRPLIVRIRQAAADLSDPSLGSEADVGPFVQLSVGLLAAAFCSAALAVGVWLFREPWGVWWQGLRRTRTDVRDSATLDGRASVAFYARWEALLARCGHVRAASQTQREFSAEVAQCIAAARGDPRVVEWSRQIIHAFYTVRFGPGTLGDEQAALVETALQGIQQATQTQSLAAT